MRIENTSLSKPILPVTLTRISQRTRPNLLGCPTLRGMGSPLSYIVEQGKAFLESKVNEAKTGSNSAHIAAQNQAGSDMNAIVQQYNQLKNQGMLSLDLIVQHIAAMQQVIRNFQNFAAQVGTTRAANGAKDIAYYGGLAITDMQNDARAMGGNAPITLPGGVNLPSGQPGGFTLPSIQTVSSYLPLILAGVFAFAILPLASRRSS